MTKRKDAPKYYAYFKSSITQMDENNSKINLFMDMCLENKKLNFEGFSGAQFHLIHRLN